MYHFICKCCWSTSWNSKCKFYVNFFSNKNNQKITKHNKKQKKHDKILMLAKSKLDSIGTLVSQALIDVEISHEEFMRLLGRNKNMRMKENVRNVSEKQENMRLNSVNSRKIMSLWIIYSQYCWQYIFNNPF